MIKIKRSEIVSIRSYNKEKDPVFKFRKPERYLFGLIKKQGGIFDFLGYPVSELPYKNFIENGVIYEKPKIRIFLTNGKYINIHKDTIQDCEDYINRLINTMDEFIDPENI